MAIIITFASVLLILVLVLIVLIIPGNKVENGFASGGIKADLRKFLGEANDALIMAYEKRDVIYFSEFCTDEFCEYLGEAFYAEDLPLFGSRTYRKVTWNFIEDEGSSCVIQRLVTFNNVKIRGVTVALGEPVDEQWYIKKGKRGYTVEHII